MITVVAPLDSRETIKAINYSLKRLARMGLELVNVEIVPQLPPELRDVEKKGVPAYFIADFEPIDDEDEDEEDEELEDEVEVEGGAPGLNLHVTTTRVNVEISLAGVVPSKEKQDEAVDFLRKALRVIREEGLY